MTGRGSRRIRATTQRGGRSRSGAFGALTFGLVAAGCEGAAHQSIMHPAGDGARMIAQLGWFMFVLGGIVYAIVLGLLVWALRRRRTEAEPRPASPVLWLAVGGAAIPFGIIAIVFGATLWTMVRDARVERDADMIVKVVGHRWWWEVEYVHAVPQERVRTANELYLPVGRAVRVELESRDLIHSLWVPNLHGKVDMIPGRRNVMWLRADRAGVYRGQCAEFCGLQHANMALIVVAVPQAEFDAWYANQQRPGATPAEPLAAFGQEVFLRRDCAMCHTVRGTAALGTAGPDLTHVASRATLAAGTLTNNRGNLSGWISDPQRIKPGNFMPAVPLTSAELLALTAYLETLR